MFAVPGEITSALSAGTNALLRLGATPLTSRRRRARGVRARAAAAPLARARRAADAVLEALARRAGGRRRARPRAPASTPAAVAAALAELELAGSSTRARRALPGGEAARHRIADIVTSSVLARRASAAARRTARPRRARPTSPSSAAASRAARARCTLAEAGLRVRLHEAREIAGGASGRNGGFALRGGARRRTTSRARASARERRACLWQRTEAALDRLEQLAGDAFRRTGSLRLAADDDERAELASRVRGAARGRLRRRVASTSCRSRWPGRFDGAIFHPPDAALQPARWVRRLAARAAEAGAEIREHERVESLDELDAEHVVVATDGYPSGLAPRAREPRSCPTRGQMVATEPLAERAVRAARTTPARLRLLAADAGRPARRRRLPRRVARPRADDRDEATTPRSRARSRRSSPSCSASGRRDHAPLGGDLRPRPRTSCPLVGRVPGARRRLGRGRLLGPRQRARPRSAASSSRARSSDSAAPELALFDPARLLGG